MPTGYTAVRDLCMNSEAVEALHGITFVLRNEHERRDDWITKLGPDESGMLIVTKAEAERIFSDRIAAHESRLKELGWSRTVRVETQPQGETK